LLLFSFDNSKEKRMKLFLTKIGKWGRKAGRKKHFPLFLSGLWSLSSSFFLKKEAKKEKKILPTF